jgi:two-component system chemotaxis response regulator CheB
VSAADGSVRVLLVDDSAVVRGAIGRIIDAEPDLRVATTAPNGRVALDALKHVEVDVVLLDVEMPEMDGLAALPRILAEHPKVRVIMASSLTQQGAAITMQALALGAVDFIAKPSARAGGASLSTISSDIVAKVRAVGRAARIDSLLSRGAPSPKFVGAPTRAPAVATVLGAAATDAPPRVLAIASSTGGPNALSDVLSGLAADFPLPILITQHMPPLFTGLLAQRLARDTGRPCEEGQDGAAVRPGCTYVAPGDVHMAVATHEGRPFIRILKSPPENHCRPAADVMLRSVAAIYGSSALTVVLTGMGEDGKLGCAAVRASGGRVLAQDEATSVVWGMPGAVVNAGLANWMLPLPDIASKIRALCAR